MSFPKTDYVRPKAKVPKSRLKQLMNQMGGFCGYCGTEVFYPKRGDTKKSCYVRSSTATTDHIISLSKGGAHAKENMICCCFQCNAQKRNMHLEEFRGYLYHRLNRMPLFSGDQIEWLEENGFQFPERYVPFFFEQAGFVFCPKNGLQEPK